jgi:hypothetical protein
MMHRLTDAVKAFIVMHLAMYDTPTQVAAAVKETFGLDVDRRQIWIYNPTKGRKKDKPGEQWVDLFTVTRDKFLESVSDIPIAIRAVRLRRLDRMAQQLERNRNPARCCAAPEAGGRGRRRCLQQSPRGRRQG